MLTREQILSHDDTKFDIVPVPEWGGDVRIKTLSYGTHRKLFKNTSVDDDQYHLRVLVATCVDEQGQPLFTLADLAKLDDKNPDVVYRIYLSAAKLLSPEKIEAEKKG